LGQVLEVIGADHRQAVETSVETPYGSEYAWRFTTHRTNSAETGKNATTEMGLITREDNDPDFY
jgi:hypothetical protein